MRGHKSEKSVRNDGLESRRLSKFELSLMDIDAEQLAVPDTSYAVTVGMPSSEFLRVVRDLSGIGDSSEMICDDLEVTVPFCVVLSVCSYHLRFQRGSRILNNRRYWQCRNHTASLHFRRHGMHLSGEDTKPNSCFHVGDR